MVTASEIENIIRKGIEKYSQEFKVEKEQIAIRFSVQKGEIHYLIMMDFKSKKEVELKDLIGDHFYNFLVKKQLGKILSTVAVTNGFELKDISLLTLLKNDQVIIWLYKGTESVKKLSVKEII